MRNTICATLTAITLTLCTALAGCGQVRRLAVLRRGRRIHGMRHHPDRHEASRLRHHRRQPRHIRNLMRLGSRERSGQGATVKIGTLNGAVYIAPEDDEERQACEIAVNTLLRWSAEHDKEKDQQ